MWSSTLCIMYKVIIKQRFNCHAFMPCLVFVVQLCLGLFWFLFVSIASRKPEEGPARITMSGILTFSYLSTHAFTAVYIKQGNPS